MVRHLRCKRLFLLIPPVVLLVIGGVVWAQSVSLPNDNIPTENLPPNKLAFLQNVEATEVAVQTAVPAAPKGPITYPPSVPTPIWPTGIFTGGPVPFPSEYYYIGNMWQGVLGTDHIQVYAGLARERIEPPRGVLVVEAEPVSTTTSAPSAPEGEYLTPTQAGAIHIVSVSETCLDLATDGTITASLTTPTPHQTFQFDLATRQWACGANGQPSP
jgi:hypothetical protein